MAYTPLRDVNPRIRILSCDPEPAPKKSRKVPLVITATLVAVAGITATLYVRSATAPASVALVEQPPVATRSEPVHVDGAASVTTFRQTRLVPVRMRQATAVNFPAAAKRAASELAREKSVQVSAPTTNWTAAEPSTARIVVPSTARIVVPSTSTHQGASGTSTGSTSSSAGSASASQPTSVGPEQAPGPGDPITP